MDDNYYIVIDIETPNYNNDRISAIGITMIKNTKIVQNFYSLVNPETVFESFHTALTGIDSEKVRGKPTFPELWPQIRYFLNKGTIVGHNAAYDLKVLCRCLKSYHINWKECFLYIDTLRIARKEFPELISKSLNSLCRYWSINLHHHNAGSDSAACAELLCYYIRKGISVDEYKKTYALHKNSRRVMGMRHCSVCDKLYDGVTFCKCPFCDGIDFSNISAVTIVVKKEIYGEEVHQEADYLSILLPTDQDDNLWDKPKFVTESVLDGIEYTFNITYNDGACEKRTYFSTTEICQRLLHIENPNVHPPFKLNRKTSNSKSNKNDENYNDSKEQLILLLKICGSTRKEATKTAKEFLKKKDF